MARAGGAEPASAAGGDGSPFQAGSTGWAEYQAGEGFIRALAEGRNPRAVWSALPGEDWPARIAEAAAATLAAGGAWWRSCPTPATSIGWTPR